MNSTNHTTNLVIVLLLETLVNLVNWQISSGGAAFFFFSTFTTFLVKFRTLTLPVSVLHIINLQLWFLQQHGFII